MKMSGIPAAVLY